MPAPPSDHPRERETYVPCPKCKGERFFSAEDAPNSVRGEQCDFCQGVGAVRPMQLAQWLLAHPEDRG